jgi:hypothetical protein
MKGNSSLETGLLQSMMFFNQEKKWKDWANRGKRKGEERRQKLERRKG